MLDIDIRDALARELRREHADPRDNRIWSELSICLGASWVDLCLINGALSGYEIKSDRDSFARLNRQIDHYNKVLDFASLVVTPKYLGRAREVIPPWWGLVQATNTTDGLVVRTIRKPKRNRLLEPKSLVQLLWRDEAMLCLRSKDAHRGLSKATRWEVWDRLVDVLSPTELRDAVRATLKARPIREADERLLQDDAKWQ